MEEYERREMNLGREIEQFIQRRRERPGANASEPGERAVDSSDRYVDYLDDALLRSADVIAELKQNLGLTPLVQEAGPLHPKERESLLLLVAALYRIRDKKLDDKDLVGILSLPASPNGRKLSRNTVRKHLEEAGSVRQSARNKNKSSIDG